MAKILQMANRAAFKQYDHIAEKALLNYEIEPDAIIHPLNYSENMVYLIEEIKRKRRFILRVGKPDYHHDGEVEAELSWMNILKRETTVEIPDVIPGIDDSDVQKIYNSDRTDIYYCVMFTFLTGRSLEDDIDCLPAYFEKIGEITAQFHNINGKRRIVQERFNRPVWNFETTLGTEPKWGRWQDGPEVTSQRKALFQRVSELIHKRLDIFGQSDDSFGLIHADLRTVNLLSENQNLKVIDFDDCGFSWYLYDLAASLSFIEHTDIVPELVRLWLMGYRRHRRLTDEEEQEIPTFIMLRRLLLLGWIGSHSDTETARQMGARFTEQTEIMAQRYLSRFS